MAKNSTDMQNNQMSEQQMQEEQLRKEHEYLIKNKKVRRQTRRRNAMIIILVILLILALLSGAAYAIMQFADESNFRISVSQTGTAWLSLSKDYAFTNPTSVLDVAAPKNMSDVTYTWIDVEDVYNTDGSYRRSWSNNDGLYYIATTFYLKNSGNRNVAYREKIKIEQSITHMDKAVRVFMLKDETPLDENMGMARVYAAPKCDDKYKTVVDDEGNPVLEEVVPPCAENSYEPFIVKDNSDGFYCEDDLTEDGVWMTVPFAGDGYVLNSELYPLEPDNIIKYTIIIWLEGNDKQCVDEILGGEVKISVEFATEEDK